MKKILNNIYKQALQATDAAAKKDFNEITDNEIDKLAETIELLNDVYELIYDKVFDDSEIILKNQNKK